MRLYIYIHICIYLYVYRIFVHVCMHVHFTSIYIYTQGYLHAYYRTVLAELESAWVGFIERHLSEASIARRRLREALSSNVGWLRLSSRHVCPLSGRVRGVFTVQPAHKFLTVGNLMLFPQPLSLALAPSGLELPVYHYRCLRKEQARELPRPP